MFRNKKARKKKYPKFILIVIIALSAFIIPGYAYVNSDLDINLEVLARRGNMGVEVRNIRVLDSSTYETQSNSMNNNILNYSVTFNQPNQKYIIAFDIVNTGTLELELEKFSLAQRNMTFTTTFYYDNDEPVKKGDHLQAGETKGMKLEIVSLNYLAKDAYDYEEMEHGIEVIYQPVKNTMTQLHIYDGDGNGITQYDTLYVSNKSKEIVLENTYDKKMVMCSEAIPKIINDEVVITEVSKETVCILFSNYNIPDEKIYGALIEKKLIQDVSDDLSLLDNYEDDEEYNEEDYYDDENEINYNKNNLLVLDDITISKNVNSYKEGTFLMYSNCDMDINGKQLVFEVNFEIGRRLNIKDSKGNGKIIFKNQAKIENSEYTIIDGIEIELINSDFLLNNKGKVKIKNCNIKLNDGSLTNGLNVDIIDSTITSNSMYPIIYSSEGRKRLLIKNSTITSSGSIVGVSAISSIFICNSRLNTQAKEFTRIMGDVFYSSDSIFSNGTPQVEVNEYEYGLLQDDIACSINEY